MSKDIDIYLKGLIISTIVVMSWIIFFYLLGLNLLEDLVDYIKVFFVITIGTITYPFFVRKK